MTRKEITAIALKFFALFILIDLLNLFIFFGFGVFYTVYSWFFTQPEPPVVNLGGHAIVLTVIGILALALPIVIAYLLWRLANRLVDDTKVEASNKLDGKSFPVSEITQIMIVGIGLWVTIASVADVANSSTILVKELMHQSTGFKGGINTSTIVWFLSASLKLILGMSLVLGRKRWSEIIFKLRYAGR